MRYGMVFAALILTSCTDGTMAKLDALGHAGDITCYSGGQVIYSGRSTGKIASEQQSDGWFFKDSKTGKLIRVSGDCIVSN